MTKTFFFDLDGTLSNSRPGLVHALAAAFDALGIETDVDLVHYVGAPLPAIFRAAVPGIDDIDIEYGVRKFRAAYEAYGVENAPLFSGAAEMLAALKAKGRQVWLVTAKPLPMARRVIAAGGIACHFDGVVGAGLAETDTKTSLVAQALAQSGAAREETLMLGDRAYDVIGALENDVLPVGALWGYGGRQELETAGCRRFAVDVQDFAVGYV